ncbi:helix-turn-helix domain-containing protein [Amycolatopsis sp. K13G38]|uniref:Helix-turn-helix domain-containing protein n=1 Tax=Amycolatopsis acididurans TaxID=2724524 RepID=A0ABX1IVA3_9PSEU|nr:helix-turn-helix domain-containing protein [Amycolatopsis acididurans]NKQ51381.1 helix-turn-helix domain-containing protein [Amycolatopsis acididurans]
MTSVAEHAADLVSQSERTVPFGSWTSAVRRGVMRFQFDCDRPRAFAGIFTNRSLAGVSFINMSCGRHAAYRDAATISQADSGFYVLTLQLSGELRMTQDEKIAVLKPGLFAVYDSSRPAAITASDDYSSTCIRFPKERLGSRAPEPLAGITATAFEYGPGLSATVWDLLISLNRNLETLGDHGPAAVRGAMDLVSALLRVELGGEPAAQWDLLGHVKGYIEDNLGDPGLTPGRIAAAHYISPRHLHHLFEETGTSVGRWIRTRRIEMCRRDLADPALARVPASSIGTRWGFRGASHFGHVFKRETGRTPAEYRFSV